MLRAEEGDYEDDQASIQPAQCGDDSSGIGGSVYDHDDEEEAADDDTWRPRGRCGSGALLLMAGRGRPKEAGGGGAVKGEGAESDEEEEVEVALDLFDPESEEGDEDEEILFVVDPTGASAPMTAGGGKAKRMKTGTAGSNKPAAASARHHRLDGGSQAHRQQIQEQQQRGRLRRRLLLLGAGAAAALLVVGAVTAAGSRGRQRTQHHAPLPLAVEEQGPVVQYEVASIPPAPDAGPRAPPPTVPPEPVATPSENATLLPQQQQNVLDAEAAEDEGAMSAAASVAAAVADGHANRTRALRGIVSGVSNRLQWPRRISDYLKNNNDNDDGPQQEPPALYAHNDNDEEGPNALGIAIRRWFHAAAHGSRRRRGAWQSAFERVASLVAAVMDGVEAQGQGAAGAVAEPPLTAARTRGAAEGEGEGVSK